MAIRKLLAAALVLACVSFNAAAKKSKAAEKEKAELMAELENLSPIPASRLDRLP